MNDLPPARRTSTAAILSLIFGVLTWFALPFLGAVVAVICGHVARGEIRRSGGALDGDGLAVAGLVLGWAYIALTLFVVALLFGFIGVAGSHFDFNHWLQQLHQSPHGSGTLV